METTVYLVFVTELCAGNRLNVWVSGAPSGAFWGWGGGHCPCWADGENQGAERSRNLPWGRGPSWDCIPGYTGFSACQSVPGEWMNQRGAGGH